MKPAIYLISLARAAGRRKLMQETLAEAGLQAQQVEAVDLQSTPEAELLQKCRSFGPWGAFHPGNMACTLSHALAWEQFLASDAQHAVILEDDVFLSPELRAWLEDLSWWPAGCELVNLEFWLSDSLRVMIGRGGAQHMGREVAPMLSRNPGSAGYIVTRKAARQLLEAQPFDLAIDQLLFNPLVSRLAVSLKPHQVVPALVKQGNTPPEEATLLGPRRRPEGAAYRRQKLQRGLAELRAVPLHLLRLMTGRARLCRVTYQDRALTGDNLDAATQAPST